MLNNGRPVTANLLSAAPGQAGTTRPSSPTVTIQSGGATAAGAVAGGGGASAGKSAAKATPDATTSNPTEMGHEADDMTTQPA
jgi:anti-sigma factor RsiW